MQDGLRAVQVNLTPASAEELWVGLCAQVLILWAGAAHDKSWGGVVCILQLQKAAPQTFPSVSVSRGSAASQNRGGSAPTYSRVGGHRPAATKAYKSAVS